MRILIAFIATLFVPVLLAQQSPVVAPVPVASPPSAVTPAPSAETVADEEAGAPLLPSFALEEGASLRVELPVGRLQVRPSADGRVHVAGSVQPGQRLRLLPRQSGSLLRLDDPDRLQPEPAELLLQVPAAVPLHLAVRDASLDLQDVGGGGLSIEGGRGELVVRTDAPRVRLSSLAGDIRLDAGGGDITIDTLTGDVTLSTRAVATSAVVQSLAGDVTATLPQPGRTRVVSVSGTVLLQLGQGSLPVEAETVGGNIVVLMPDTLDAGMSVSMGRGMPTLPEGKVADADGRVRWGAAQWPLRLRTLSGGIAVREGPLPPPQSAPATAAK